MMSDPVYMTLSDVEARLERYEHNVTELRSRDHVDSVPRGGVNSTSR